jgi:hypothetical protein
MLRWVDFYRSLHSGADRHAGFSSNTHGFGLGIASVPSDRLRCMLWGRYCNEIIKNHYLLSLLPAVGLASPCAGTSADRNTVTPVSFCARLYDVVEPRRWYRCQAQSGRQSFATIAAAAASGTSIHSGWIEAGVGICTGARCVEEGNAHACSDKGLKMRSAGRDEASVTSIYRGRAKHQMRSRLLALLNLRTSM